MFAPSVGVTMVVTGWSLRRAEDEAEALTGDLSDVSPVVVGAVLAGGAIATAVGMAVAQAGKLGWIRRPATSKPVMAHLLLPQPTPAAHGTMTGDVHLVALSPDGAWLGKWRERLARWLTLATPVDGPRDGRGGEVDDLVLGRARHGDHRAFAEIVGHYDERLRALAYRLLGDRDRMDDVLQEAYVKAYRALPQFRGESKFGTWLYRITYNACQRLHGRAARDPSDDTRRAGRRATVACSGTG